MPRTADCAVGGFLNASAGKIVGSLLLGLYNDSGMPRYREVQPLEYGTLAEWITRKSRWCWKLLRWRPDKLPTHCTMQQGV